MSYYTNEQLLFSFLKLKKSFKMVVWKTSLDGSSWEALQISDDELPVELWRWPDCEVALLHLHHVQHPLHLIVVIMILLQLPLSIITELQAEVVIIQEWFKWFISTFVRTFDLHKSFNIIVFLNQTIRNTDKPFIILWNELLWFNDCKRTFFSQFFNSVSFVCFTVSSCWSVGICNVW